MGKRGGGKGGEEREGMKERERQSETERDRERFISIFPQQVPSVDITFPDYTWIGF